MSEYADWVDDARDDDKPDWAYRCEGDDCDGWEAKLTDDGALRLCPSCLALDKAKASL